jgi:Tfp pilus assembly protein PilO
VSRRGPLIAGAIAVVLAVLMIMFLVLPKMGEVEKAKEALAVAEADEQQLQLQLQQLQAAQAEAPQATEEIRRLEELVPPRADLPGLILVLSGAANDAGVDFFTMAPGVPAPNTEQTFSAIPTSVTVTGSYFAIEEFLYNVETLQRAGKVLSLSLAPGGGDSAAPTGTTDTTTTTTATATGELTAQLSIEFYTTDLASGPGTSPDEPPPDDTVGATTPTPPAPGV